MFLLPHATFSGPCFLLHTKCYINCSACIVANFGATFSGPYVFANQVLDLVFHVRSRRLSSAFSGRCTLLQAECEEWIKIARLLLTEMTGQPPPEPLPPPEVQQKPKVRS